VLPRQETAQRTIELNAHHKGTNLCHHVKEMRVRTSPVCLIGPDTGIPILSFSFTFSLPFTFSVPLGSE